VHLTSAVALSTRATGEIGLFAAGRVNS